MKHLINSVADLYRVLEKRESWINPSLDNITDVCRKLGNPQNKYDVVQVAGTNGKTSTSTYLSYILRSEGLKVGRYTSPHLESFTERITINGEQISEESLVQLVRDIYEERLSGFEILTAVAFKYFVDEGVDIAVMEVGMGGRWDATSVANSKLVALTNVDLDHTEILGETKELIALEKIETVKEGTVLVTTEIDSDILEIFNEHCSKLKSTIVSLNKDFIIDGNSNVLSTQYGAYEGFDRVQTSWQPYNMALAIASAEQILESRISEQTFESLIREHSQVLGRMELVSNDPPVIIDGAHNPAAAKKLAETLRDRYPAFKITLILGILGDKDIDGIMQYLAPLANKIILTRNNNARSASTQELLLFANKYGKELSESSSLENAIESATHGYSSKELICITGSLYTVGTARSIIKDMMKYGAVIDTIT